MDLWNCKFSCFAFNSLACRCLALVLIVLVFRTVLFPTSLSYNVYDVKDSAGLVDNSSSFLLGNNVEWGIRKEKFLEVPQIVWGLNNQKIAFARACLTARMLNRTLLVPSLSGSLFYKEIEQLQAVAFDKIFQLTKFNSLCHGFVQLGQYSELLNRTGAAELQKGSGRKWTPLRDLDQLKQFKEDPYDQYEVLRIVGKNPFLWHDHWPVKDYARIFECVVLLDEFAKEAESVISRLRAVGKEAEGNNGISSPYMAVHMRIEKDWMIHCKNLERRLNINEICSSKEEIMQRVGNIKELNNPTVVYLAVADSLLEDKTILSDWKEGLLPFEKKKLGVDGIYNKYPYLIKSAIDYEVCLRADIFVGNSFSTFSSLIVLERTQKMGILSSCKSHQKWPSYAYNIKGDFGGPQRWMSNMSDISLQAISYGTNHVECQASSTP